MAKNGQEVKPEEKKDEPAEGRAVEIGGERVDGFTEVFMGYI